MKHFKYIIIGAGPAGVQLAYFLEKEKKDYLVIERKDAPGAFFKTYPVHRRLISINKVYTGYDDDEINMRWDWNSLLSEEGFLFKEFSKEYFPPADVMVEYLNAFAKKFDLKIQCNTEITQIRKDQLFYLTDDKGEEYSCEVLLVATGMSKPYIPPIPGIEMVHKYTDIIRDKTPFINKNVLVIGKGNAGFETADFLIDTAASIHVSSPNTLKLAWDTHFVGHLRAVNNNLLDTYHLKSQNAVLDADILKIERKGEGYTVTFRYSNKAGEVEELYYDSIILCAGFKLDDTIFDHTCRPEMAINDRFADLTVEWESTNVKDLYFIGALMQARDFKKFTSSFIHGFRYNVRFLSNILNQKYEEQALAYSEVDLNPDEVLSVIIEQINSVACLWQQQSFFCDALMINDGQARYYKSLTKDYVKEVLAEDFSEFFMISLEFGKESPGHGSNDRVNRKDHQNAAQSKFLHPIIRHYKYNELMAEHHIIEDLMAEWREPEHLDPLSQFLKQNLPHYASNTAF